MNRMARRGPWLPEEDRTLLHLVQTQGANNWVRISQQLQHRSPKQCRERYHQNLKPSLKHEPISAQEGEIIEQMVSDMGKRWAEIARSLGNRSDNAVKNWWNGSMNRRRRNPTQATTNFKHIGNRMRPIPFTNPDKPAYRAPPVSSLLFKHDAYGPTHAPPPPRLHHLPPSTLPEPGHSPPRASRPQSLRLSGDRQDSNPTQLSSPQDAGPEPREPYNSTHATFPKPALSRPQTSPHRPELPPLRQSTYANGTEARGSTHDLPLVSPALSDISQSLRQAPPSLVSDNLSTCSISPKTVTSPHLNLLTALDFSTAQWQPHHQSAHRTQHHHPPQHQHHHRGPSAGLSLPLSAPAAAVDRRKKDYPPPLESLRNEAYDNMADAKPKDSRMHLSSLLG